MNHQVGVGVLHGVHHLAQQAHTGGGIQGAVGGRLGDGRAFHVLQRHVGLPVVGNTGVVQAGDVRVDQPTQDVALAFEALDQHAAAQAEHRQLQRHVALELAVGTRGQPHLAHATAAHRAQQAVGPDAVARMEVAGRSRTVGCSDRGGLLKEVFQFTARLARQHPGQCRAQPRGLSLQRLKPGIALARRQFGMLIQQLRQQAQVIGTLRHAGSSSAAASNNLALVQSRRTVRSVRPRISATSTSVSPAK